MKKYLVAGAAITLVGAFALPAQAQIPAPHGGYYHPGGHVYVAPPAPRYEPIPHPRAGHVWTPGYWAPYNGSHQWIAGHWVAQGGYVHPNQGYREGGWAERRWERRHGYRDSDGDGVPNRYDSRPHNPYRH